MLTASQMYDWEIYSIAEPFGQPRSDYMAGTMAASNANLWIKEKVHPEDFIPGQNAPEATEEEIVNASKAFAASMRR
jgi:hypothetical protein